MTNEIEIPGTPYVVALGADDPTSDIDRRVRDMRAHGKLSPQALEGIRKYFRIKNVYNSNAIEGNVLDIGETRQVVELGLTITGKPLKDQAEATNLADALDYLETLATDRSIPLMESDIRHLHTLVLKGINDNEAGCYRSVPVEISGSDYKPPGPESVPAQMEAFGRWLAEIPADDDLGVSRLATACAAHTWFVTIHPFIDGNGRVARLLLNLLLMRFGYPIAIITKDDRLRYYDALEESQTSDLSGLVSLVAECVDESLEEYERAVAEQADHEEWTRTIARRLTQQQRIRAQNEYEVWKSAMELLKGYFRQTAEALDESATFGRVFLKDLGTLEFEKYASLRDNQSAKRTWFFRLDFRSGDIAARYLFFFGSASRLMREQCDVTLLLAREQGQQFHYERLDHITLDNVPDLREIGYVPSEERFLARYSSNATRLDRIEAIGRQFIEQVVQMHFAP